MSSDRAVAPEPAEAKTFPQLIRAAAAAYGDAVAIAIEDDAADAEAATFAELDSRSALIARGLIAKGIGKGARVGFIFRNGPDFALMLAAIGRIGAVAVPISTMIRANELVRVLRQSDIQGLVIQRAMLGKDYAERIGEALPELAGHPGGDLRLGRVPYLRWIVSSGPGLPAAIRPMAFLTGAAETVGEDLLREIEAEVHPTDQFVEIYTSGSMALPKGVKHLHGPVLFRARTLAGMLGIAAGGRCMAQLPMFWVGGMMLYLLPSWMAGATTICTERTLSNSRFAMGSVLAEEDLKLIQGPRPWWGLGMSETLGPYSWGDDFRAPGYPVCAPMDHFGPGYEIRVADENDQPVGDGEVGEMQVRGYPVTPALHKVERAEHFTADGYFRTGDMCLVEDRPQGRRIHFVGRNGDMIKAAGSNVSPAEVEMEMQQLEGVHNAYVVGLPDKERGQLVVAAVVPREGVELDFAAIERALRQRLSSYKVPRAYVAIAREDVPLLHSNKVARRQIASMMAERLGRV
ncbi:class I adenylate-forming enzyme family protein [Novosphingobium album (ex Liu et al. 2023)]|uniref:Class I adenylate-forming enzyme family protein n=1 Tax=Novosphingobium album (ex Liu et al. 2023) TaxID=3031130 RepID=A0ABT5WWX5_9SPHN|nr:class I adenylate-forming enzyme family protein [Novosphingobium album (ex Liu et al. 2023)]MDE8654405.1 class I adenylate-forming enzyme family protein [Novosphingobium album (ex Liu et al. 2023)]